MPFALAYSTGGRTATLRLTISQNKAARPAGDSRPSQTGTRLTKLLQSCNSDLTDNFFWRHTWRLHWSGSADKEWWANRVSRITRVRLQKNAGGEQNRSQLNLVHTFDALDVEIAAATSDDFNIYEIPAAFIVAKEIVLKKRKSVQGMSAALRNPGILDAPRAAILHLSEAPTLSPGAWHQCQPDRNWSRESQLNAMAAPHTRDIWRN